MTIAVDWHVKQQNKQNKQTNRKKFLNYDVFLSLKVVLILANSADPDEMQHYAAFHLGLPCLPKYLFRRFLYTKG